MALYQWSLTPASNATADPTINFSEGMAPSAINDSARAMMARLAEYRDDISGIINTGGTGAAYSVTSNQVFDTLAHMAGQMIAFRPNLTNTGAVTLNVDGLGAKPLRASPGVDMPSGTLLQATPYVATYNNSDGAWYLHGFALNNPYNIPLGGMLPYTGSTPPNSAFAFPNGQQISQTTYAALYALYGFNRFGIDAGGNFFLPDLRGRAVFGLDNGGANRITVAGGNFNGSVIGGGGAENHTLSVAEMPTHTHTVTDPGHNHSHSDPGHNHTLTDPGHLHSLGISTVGSYTQTSSGVAKAPGGGDNSGSATTGITLAPAATGITNVATTTGISLVTNGSGSAHSILPPAMVLPYILRII